MSWRRAGLVCGLAAALGWTFAAQTAPLVSPGLAASVPGTPALVPVTSASAASAPQAPSAAASVNNPATATSNLPLSWAPLDALVQAQIAATQLPGAVVLLGDADGVRYQRAYGERSRVPAHEAMTLDTVFDLASVTKVVATTTAVLQLVERHQIELDAPVARYWPEFAAHGKGAITVRQLLAHTSGLRADVDLAKPWSGRRAALARFIDEKPIDQPGAHVLYSDINFAVLGELVQRVSRQSLPDYTR